MGECNVNMKHYRAPLLAIVFTEFKPRWYIAELHQLNMKTLVCLFHVVGNMNTKIAFVRNGNYIVYPPPPPPPPHTHTHTHTYPTPTPTQHPHPTTPSYPPNPSLWSHAVFSGTMLTSERNIRSILFYQLPMLHFMPFFLSSSWKLCKPLLVQVTFINGILIPIPMTQCVHHMLWGSTIFNSIQYLRV